MNVRHSQFIPVPYSTGARRSHTRAMAAAQHSALPRRMLAEFPNPLPFLAVAVELAFLCNTFEGFTRTLDAVLVLVAFQWQELYDFEATARTETSKWPRCITHDLTDRVFVRFQQTPLSPGMTPPLCLLGWAPPHEHLQIYHIATIARDGRKIRVTSHRSGRS